MFKKQVPEQKNFSLTEYFHFDRKYQLVVKYHQKNEVLLIPNELTLDLDDLFVNFVEIVLFQNNSQLYYILTGKNW